MTEPDVADQGWWLESLTEGDLRQGDVAAGWVVPSWKPNNTSLLTGGTTGMLVSALEHSNEIPVLICSHDCDLDNDTKARRGVLVAPILPWPYPAGDSRSASLQNSRVPAIDDAGAVFSFVNLWPLQIPEQVGTLEPGWYLADLSAMTSMQPANKVVPQLRSKRIMEMTDYGRGKFAEKLAAMFLRSQ